MSLVYKFFNILFVLAIVCFGIYWIATSIDGMAYYTNTVVAIVGFAILMMIFPAALSVFVYIGAVHVDGWPWYYAALLAMPGIAFVMIGSVSSMVEMTLRRLRGN
ncbi:hypothetical protein HJ071_09885 [Vibrio parahaemolyticus]|nr:hypothetical protein [Vibrio parahaemolyticus]